MARCSRGVSEIWLYARDWNYGDRRHPAHILPRPELRHGAMQWTSAERGPVFRTFAPLLLLKILKHRVTHTNVSPSPHTLPTIEALASRRFCNGTFAAIPVLAAQIGKAKIRRVVDATHPERFVPAGDLQILLDHKNFGCSSLWCETQDKGYPFTSGAASSTSTFGAGAQLVDCASLDDLVRLAGPIGKYLALRGMPLLLIPANGPIPKLVGKFFGGKPMDQTSDRNSTAGGLGLYGSGHVRCLAACARIGSLKKVVSMLSPSSKIGAPYRVPVELFVEPSMTWRLEHDFSYTTAQIRCETLRAHRSRPASLT